MLEDLDMEDAYGMYAISSDSVHGGWSNLQYEFLIEMDGRYYPDLDDHCEDVREILDVTLLCFMTLRSFLESFQGHGIPSEILTEIMKDLPRIQDFIQIHQNFIKGKPLNKQW